MNPRKDRERMEKAIALLDSDVEGEAISALVHTRKLLKRYGLKLSDLFAPPATLEGPKVSAGRDVGLTVLQNAMMTRRIAMLEELASRYKDQVDSHKEAIDALTKQLWSMGETQSADQNNEHVH